MSDSFNSLLSFGEGDAASYTGGREHIVLNAERAREVRYRSRCQDTLNRKTVKRSQPCTPPTVKWDVVMDGGTTLELVELERTLKDTLVPAQCALFNDEAQIAQLTHQLETGR